jgi:hypothetical protein
MFPLRYNTMLTGKGRNFLTRFIQATGRGGWQGRNVDPDMYKGARLRIHVSVVPGTQDPTMKFNRIDTVAGL